MLAKEGDSIVQVSSGGEVEIKIYEGTRVVATLSLNGPAELGRREPNEPPPFGRIARTGCDRLIIADLTETSVSRKHLRVETCGEGRVKLRNESAKAYVVLADGLRLSAGESVELELPAACEVGNKVVRLDWRALEESNLQSLGARTMAPGQASLAAQRPQSANSSVFATLMGGGGNQTDVIEWLQASMDVFQSAAASSDFLFKAVTAASQLVELDTVAVVLREAEAWKVSAVSGRGGKVVDARWQPSQSMLRRVAEQQRTFFQVPSGRSGVAQSLVGVQSIVAAPILDPNGQTIGVLYGEGRSGGGAVRPVSELEAKLFELLAYGVASGIARVEQERKLIAERVRFEQFFTPELARELETHGDDLLAARDAEVTILFCDIKGFSRISAKCGAALAIEWVREVLSELSDRVAEHQGVLVDYGGDSLEALWGAPLAAPDHALQAARAALAMRTCLPALNERWESRLGEATDVSIGINTGRAQVGNIGSRRKFKYGAFGTTVNLASRVQGATKHLGVPLLITRSTRDRLDDQSAVRRLCTVRTVNISEPVELFELVSAPDSRWQSLQVQFEEALRQFEQGRFVEAMGLLGQLVAAFPHDEPTRKLLQRNVACLSQPAGAFDPVWNLDSK